MWLGLSWRQLFSLKLCDVQSMGILLGVLLISLASTTNLRYKHDAWVKLVTRACSVEGSFNHATKAGP